MKYTANANEHETGKKFFISHNNRKKIAENCEF